MEKELISIIIPVYNVEDYLGKCINIILKQTYENLEIILVNDCSTDHSGYLCHYYAKRDSRIKVFEHSRNHGAGIARNTGIDIATGQYIMFVDADDYVALNYVEELYKLLIRSKSDVAVCLGKAVYSCKTIRRIEKGKLNEYKLMNSEKAISDICYQREFTPGPWAKIFKANLFEEIRFPDTGYEDLAIIYKILDKANKIAYSPVEKYYYVQRKNNTTLGEFNKKKMDRIYVAEDMKKYVDERYPDLSDATATRCFIANIQTLNVLPSNRIRTSFGNIIKENIRQYRKLVVKNNQAKASTRLMALMSYLGMRNLKILGNIYNISRGTYKLKLK